MRVTQLFVNRPTLLFVLMVLILIVGGVSFATLVNQQFPNIDFPTISVRLSYPGGSTSEIRDAIVRPIEDAIAGAPNLDHLTTTIQNGQANISATFTLNSNKTTDLVEVQRRVQSAEGNLPSDLTTPTVASFDAGEPTVAQLIVTSRSLTPAALSALVQNSIVPDLEQAPGVANVNANGAVTQAIEVQVNPNALSASGLTLADIVSAIGANNVRAPGGIVYQPDRETSVDVRGDVTDPASVANLFIAATAGGSGAAAPSAPSGAAALNRATLATPAPSLVGGASSGSFNAWSVAPRYLRIGDVATVESSYETRRTYSYVNGVEAMTLGVQKTTGASELAASNGVLAALPTMEREYPQVTFGVLNVEATYTREQIDGVWHTLEEGILFTGLVMLFFLRSWRNAIVVLVAIPSSLLVTFAIMKIAGFTIDTVSLLAMSLLIGILVDDSIVILENIGRHHEKGEAPRTAAILGRNEIGFSAIVITLVDVVVFLPIAFLPGITGRFLAEFALVVVAASLTSLMVSFTVTPSLAGNWSLRSTWRPWRIIDAFGRGFERSREIYATRVLSWALGHAWIVFGASLALVAGAFLLLFLHAIGLEFFPSVDRGQIFVGVTYPTGTPLAKTDKAIAALSRLYANESSDIESVTSTAGSEQQGFGGQINIGSVGQIRVNLALDRKHSTDWWAQRFGVQARRLVPDAQTVAIPATGTGGGNSQPIDYLVESSDDQPERYAPAVLAALEQTPGAVHVTSSAANLAPQVDVVFDRERARALDVNIATAANAIRATFGGALAAQFDAVSGIEYVQVTFPQSAQQGTDSILAIPIRSNSGSVLHVGDIASLVEAPTSPLMTRTNRQTVIHVSANVGPGASLSSVQSAFMRRLGTLHLPEGVRVTPTAGGQQQNFGQAASGIVVSLMLSSALVYLLMVGLYDSYRLPFIIMFAVPVAAVGALGSLWITHETLNLFSMIGTVLLIGLVSKNGILLVDLANTRVRAGASRHSAITESARERFRPIVMTTMSMVAGMLPIALALDPGSASRQALGVVVIGGLISSLLLTLVLVPCAFVRLAPTYSDLARKATPQRRTRPRPTEAVERWG
ncbi:MAG: efflux RND transporter permease subunit [Candidatus Tyrphobacter sp.]